MSAVGTYITDGTVKWRIEAVEDAITSVETDGGIVTLTHVDGSAAQLQLVADNAPAHNAVYRGKDITADFDNGKVSENIANGTFKDIFIGDYIDKPFTSPKDGTTFNVRWRIAHLDYYLYKGDTPCITHHAVVVPDDVLDVNIRMNSSDTTNGGYVGSEMWKTTLPKYLAKIQAAFGSSHILTHREYLTKSINASCVSSAGVGYVGASNSCDWYDVSVNIMTEQQVTGSDGLYSSCYDVGESSSQFRLFDFCTPAQIAGYREAKDETSTKYHWLRAVTSSTSFSHINKYGAPNSTSASNSDNKRGIRPYFLLV